ncbi:hypothetical protein TW79_09290 [Tritonibacter mobilis]|uniref:Uncharacterized protein n=2 Tax=Tritonibacter mobilis TaxID=379347 RepID=A0A1B1AAL7_9RHOB|nr:hypothetical protein K529_022895 [Tritonibacter mobilis F1926]KJZ24392.1 hypothetical protein TW79_09290 [Tritonibacter mobilis]
MLSGARLGIFALFSVFLASNLQPVHAKSDHMTPPLLLQCPANAPDPAALCAALSAALEIVLQDAKSARHIRQSQISPTDSSQTAGADTLRLVLSDIRRDRISGHLTWQSGDGSLRTGPEVALDVMDTALSAKMYPRFARGLLQASPEIIKDLSD